MLFTNNLCQTKLLDIIIERNNRIDYLEKLMTEFNSKSAFSVPVECVKHVYELYDQVKLVLLKD